MCEQTLSQEVNNQEQSVPVLNYQNGFVPIRFWDSVEVGSLSKLIPTSQQSAKKTGIFLFCD